MRNIFLLIGMLFVLLSCQQNNKASNTNVAPGIHQCISLEKINTSKYTYLLVNENGVENWLAFPLADVNIGITYYYTGEMLMTNFESKELGRTFEKVYFIGAVYTEPPSSVSQTSPVNSNLQPITQPVQTQIEMPSSSPIPPQNAHTGIAIETMNTGSYTYLLLNENGVKNWLAFPITEIKIGETYSYSGEMLMSNFESKELHRKFDKIFFVSGVVVGNASKIMKQEVNSSTSPTPHGGAIPEPIKTKIEPVKGGITISELFANKEKYAGKTVLVKGKVTKFSPEIMDKNWIHIQDGSSYKGSYDLTITSQVQVKIGETYTLQGTVVLNKDFGAGYKYDVILENGMVK